MADQTNNIEQLESQFPALSGVTFNAALKQTLDAGLSVMQSENGVVYEVFPDGRRVPVKKIEPPTPGVPGQKITIQ